MEGEGHKSVSPPRPDSLLLNQNKPEDRCATNGVAPTQPAPRRKKKKSRPPEGVKRFEGQKFCSALPEEFVTL